MTPFDGTPSPSSDREYPEGTGPDHVNFSALNADDRNVSHSPREHWASYAVVYTAPSERPLVEGNYYINSSTGEIVGERWNDARVYLNGSTYAFVQPADGVSAREREQLESDGTFVYHEATDAYYRYDRHYGSVAPTNLGRHPTVLHAYTWEATDTTTHHGVRVVTYRATGSRTDTRAPPVVNGTLRLGVEAGVVYAFDVTLDAGERNYRYTYDVKPAPFPDHEWVDRAQEVTAENTSSAGSSESERFHVSR
ncbi:hypothetical protein [Salinigranum marinum]|uniref:hypothetical protein n=1 Tax=Salinigranum marinum TaxID=1515595 RepID=UPI002989D6AA|nr:hypothetical protein [Salinigranum marinum]